MFEVNVRPNLVFNTVVLATVVYNRLSHYMSVSEMNVGPNPCFPDSDPFNAGVES